jgi:hypothetical protein
MNKLHLKSEEKRNTGKKEGTEIIDITKKWE